MQRLKRWLLILALVLIVLLGAAFGLWNTTPVAVSFGTVTLAERPLAVWLIAAFCLGGLCGLLLSTGIIRHVRLQRRIHKLEKELASRPKFPPVDRDI